MLLSTEIIQNLVTSTRSASITCASCYNITYMLQYHLHVWAEVIRGDLHPGFVRVVFQFKEPLNFQHMEQHFRILR